MRDPWFVKADGQLAGFALARYNGDVWSLLPDARQHTELYQGKPVTQLVFQR